MWRAALALMPKIFSMYELEQGKEFEKSGRVINIRLSDGLLKAQIKDTDNHIQENVPATKEIVDI
jgi:hypothetical protein